MERIVTAAEMQACDRFAIDRLNIPGLLLMENAGRGVVDAILKRFGSVNGKSILVLCGKGNNGGDGFVVARRLIGYGACVKVVSTAPPSAIKGDARLNYDILKQMMGKVKNRAMLQLLTYRSLKTLTMLPTPDIIVDALFGTGFRGGITSNYLDIIRWSNSSCAKRVSIDIPSGVNADTGGVANVAFESDLTVTMGLKKIGLLLNEGRRYSGEAQVKDIGISEDLFNFLKHSTYLVHETDVVKAFPVRPLNAHKHSVGKILVLAGSLGLTGAAAMTALSAMKAGAGAVILGTPASVYPILAKKLTEVMVEPMPETDRGTLSLNAFETVIQRSRWADIIILGPGLGTHPETNTLVWKIVSEIDKPLLIDADGLNALAERTSILKRHKSREIIVTPHTGELCRLTGIPAVEIEAHRVEIARKFAREFKLALVFKGAPTVTASEDGMVIINPTGNPGMATAGSGDVLSGIIGGLWGQGMNRQEAAYAGVYVHGMAGDLAKGEFGEEGMLATDIQHYIAPALKRIRDSQAV